MGFTTFCGAEIPKAAEHLLRRKKTWAFSDVLERKIKNKEYVGDYLFLIDNGEVGYIYCECPVGNEVYIEYCEIDPKIDVSTRFRITLEAREQVPKFLEDKGLVIKKYMRLHYTNLQLKTKYGLKLVPVLLSISDFEKIDPVYKNVEFAAWFNYNITEILQQIVDRYYHVF